MASIVGIIVASVSLISTAVTAVLFLGKLKWDNAKQDQEIDKLRFEHEQLNKALMSAHEHTLNLLDVMKDKNTIEIKELNAKLEEMDRSLVKLSTTSEHIQISVNEIKRHMEKEV